MKLDKHIVEKPWGRSGVPAVFGTNPEAKTGEVWFDTSSTKLPLLVKWLFTSEKLSIQVHPDDTAARNCGLVSGKEECWFVVAAEPDAVLGIGTKSPISSAELRASIETGTIENIIDWKPVRTGEYYFIPAGTVHAIGGGVTIVEVQQNADVTYRLYDYGRPRELHLEDGLAVASARPYEAKHCGAIDPNADIQMLVDSEHFDLHYARDQAIREFAKVSQPIWIVPIEGRLTSHGEHFQAGDCAFFANCAELEVEPRTIALLARSKKP